jgi:integrase
MRAAALRRWRVRVSLGEPGAVWRNSPRGTWPADAIRSTLRDGCTAAGVSEFTPHAFRRAFATDAASVLPRHTVAPAGGWQGVRRLDEHYVQPDDEAIRDKLERAEGRTTGEVDQRDATLAL